MVWDISYVWKRRMGIKNIASNIFYIFHHLSRCEAPQNKWMKTLLQGRKADATNRSVGFSDSLIGVVPSSMGDRCFCIGHFRDHSVVGLPKARRASTKLSERPKASRGYYS